MASFLTRVLVRGLRSSTPLVAVVNLRGQIAPPSRGPRRFLNEARAAPWLDRAFGLRPDAVALRINSPGGSPAQTELLVAAIARRAADAGGVPVYAFAEDVAASGGMWLLAGAGTAGAYALDTSVVGSIGVIAPSFGAVDAIARLGVERRVFTAGAAKAGVDPFLPVARDAEDALRSVLTDMHAAFVDAVVAARGPALAAAAGCSLADVRASDTLFSGRVWTGRQAAALGLVDGVGSLHGVLRAKLPGAKFVECGEIVPTGRSLFGALARVPGDAVDDVAAVLEGRTAAARFGGVG